MTQKIESEESANWKKFIRKHWSIVLVFVLAGILAAAGAVYIFWWFAGNAQTIGLVPSTLNHPVR
jgi:flagellar basal body-associated protein FliL